MREDVASFAFQLQADVATSPTASESCHRSKHDIKGNMPYHLL
jgi:hypothetical protein